ncbi:MAG: hypothetical protein ACXW32_16595, partial [Limisphaerales bacterium]
MTAFLDTGFLLTILTHRSGAAKAWALLKGCEIPAEISALQLFLIRHGLQKNLVDPKEADEVQEVSVSAIKLLNWLRQQEVIRPLELDYGEVIAVAESWGSRLRTPVPSLILIGAASAAVSGADAFLSFDP